MAAIVFVEWNVEPASNANEIGRQRAADDAAVGESGGPSSKSTSRRPGNADDVDTAVVSGPVLPPIRMPPLLPPVMLHPPTPPAPPLPMAPSSFPVMYPLLPLLFGLLVPPLSKHMPLLRSANGTGGAECTELSDPTPATPQQSTANAPALIGHSFSSKRIGSANVLLPMPMLTTVPVDIFEARIGSESEAQVTFVVGLVVCCVPIAAVAAVVVLLLVFVLLLLGMGNIPAGPLERCTDPRESCREREGFSGFIFTGSALLVTVVVQLRELSHKYVMRLAACS